MSEVEKAKSLLNNVIETRRLSSCPFSQEMEQKFYDHCLSVAFISKKIAQASSNLDPEKSYIYGLLHDAGRIKDERTEGIFHGLTGFDYLVSHNMPDAARIAFTHCFYEPQLNLSMYRMKPQDYVRSRELLKSLSFNDYDYLAQLADILNDCGRQCTIEYRFDSVAKRHNLNDQVVKASIKKMNELKKYFDEKCRCNIYDLLEIEHKISV